MSVGNSTDRMAHWVHIALFSGLVASGLLLALGFALLLAVPHPQAESGALEISVLFSRAASGDGTAVLALGLLVLMLTPVLRVMVLAIGWLHQRDWAFAAVAISVLALLAASMALGTG